MTSNGAYVVYPDARGMVDPMGPSPIMLVRENSDLQVVDTTTETAILEYTVPAYTLDGDRGLRVTLDGFRINDSGSNANTVVRIKLGGTTLWDSGNLLILDLGAATELPFKLQFDLMAKNADDAQEIFIGPLNLFSGAVFYGESTEDATGDLVLQVTVQWDTAHANLDCTRRRYLIEYL